MNELKKKMAALDAEGAGILKSADDDKRGITAEEAKRLDEIEAEIATLQAEVKKLEHEEQQAAEARQRFEQGAAARRQGRGRRVPTQEGPVIDEIRDPAEDDPNGGYKSHREFLQDVMAAQTTRTVPPKLRRFQIRRGEIGAAAGSDEQGIYSDPHGGFLQPTGFAPGILTTAGEGDIIGSRVQSVPMDQPVLEIPARVDKNHSTSVSGGLTVSRKIETAQAASSRMEIEKVTLRAKSLFGVAFATMEVIERTPASFAALLEAGFRDQFTFHLTDERINGTGAGMFMGFMNSPCLITVAKEAGQSADTIVTNNILKMRARAWMYANAVWLANHDTIPQLAVMQSGDSAHIFVPSLREDIPDTLLGRPIIFTEHMKTVGDKGDIAICNFTQYLEGTLSDFRGAESVHVRFLEHENTFKFWMENDGAPWWRSALTPTNGATLSPFVTLAARA